MRGKKARALRKAAGDGGMAQTQVAPGLKDGELPSGTGSTPVSSPSVSYGLDGLPEKTGTSNRASRRAGLKNLRRITREAIACTQTFHPLLHTLTPRGQKIVDRRQAKNRVAKQSRKRNRRK